jgi:hypothetical protein
MAVVALGLAICALPCEPGVIKHPSLVVVQAVLSLVL